MLHFVLSFRTKRNLKQTHTHPSPKDVIVGTIKNKTDLNSNILEINKINDLINATTTKSPSKIYIYFYFIVFYDYSLSSLRSFNVNLLY